MKYKDFPTSQFQLIDIVASLITQKLTEWGTTSLDEMKGELSRYAEMINIGNYIVASQPDETGEVRFKIGDTVVRRSSGVFSTAYTITGIEGANVTIKRDDQDETTVLASTVREDGVAFVCSDKLKNDVEITGAPLLDSEIIGLFLDATISNGAVSPAWSQLRVFQIVPDQEGLPNIGHDFHESIVEWYNNVYKETLPKFKVGDAVTQCLHSHIVDGGCISKSSAYVGRVEVVKEDKVGKLYTVCNPEGKGKDMRRWQIQLLASK